MMSDLYDVIIIGGGAAGLMAASTSSKRGFKTLVLEGNKILGRKILISGGGRCNFTNLYTTSNNYLSSNSHFHKSALKRYSPYDFLDLIEKHKIEYFEKKDGQLFCKTSAREIISLLEKECNEGGAEIKMSAKVHSVLKKEYFEIESSQGQFTSRNVIVASGGLPISQIGATDFGLKLAKTFGHSLKETYPALVPFTLSEDILTDTSKLSGVSLEAKITTKDSSIIEDILFTHKGLSGPGILQASLYWNRGERVFLDFLPRLSEDEFLQLFRKHSKKSVDSIFKLVLPKRFVEFWCLFENISLTKKVAEYSKKDQLFLIENIKNFEFRPSGTEGYRKAEVMKGGVCTDDISSKTMESKIIKGLYFIGEVVDVTGQLGGFNFQWAWASGNAAGTSIT
jgi:predicted Rossmann fold flavoprotein